MRRGRLPSALILDKDKDAVGEVAVFAEKLGVAADLEIFPGEF